MPDYYQIQPETMAARDVQRTTELLDAMARSEHYTVATLIFKVTDPHEGQHMVLDQENVLTSPIVSCFNCGETDITKFDQPCPGRPAPV